MEVFPGISLDPDTCHGKPFVTNTQIDVATVVGMLGTGQSFQDVQDMFQISYEHILTALKYASYVTDHLPLRMNRPSDDIQPLN